MASSPSSCSSCGSSSVALVPLEVMSTCSSPSSPSRLPSPPRVRRLRRVLYPASQCRRPLPREAPDQAHRWLLLLLALVFLQIYNEEAHTCTELQSQSPEMGASPDSAGNQVAVQGWTAEESWRIQIVHGASDTQLECVVS